MHDGIYIRHLYIYICIYIYILCKMSYVYDIYAQHDMWWLRLVGSLKLQVSFGKESYKRDYILQKRPIIVRSLPIRATSYTGCYITNHYFHNFMHKICRIHMTLKMHASHVVIVHCIYIISYIIPSSA